MQSFAWQACELAESLIESEPGIDVIEAPEFEAPAYFLQLRRALGMGPARQPPILIHLHSPTELIARHNDWPSGLPDLLLAERLESYSIAAADGWICPSAYLARQAEQMYGLKPDSIDVIRYPVADWATVERSHEVWERGSICYVGRLERRKGILEWIDAAVAVAPDRDDLRFELVGSNILGATEASATTSSAVASHRRCVSASSFAATCREPRCPRFSPVPASRSSPLVGRTSPMCAWRPCCRPSGAGDPRRWHG